MTRLFSLGAFIERIIVLISLSQKAKEKKKTRIHENPLRVEETRKNFATSIREIESNTVSLTIVFI